LIIVVSALSLYVNPERDDVPLYSSSALCFQVILCANHLGYQDKVNTVLAHELVHAYDYCRVKSMDWHNLRHHACSEVRIPYCPMPRTTVLYCIW